MSRRRRCEATENWHKTNQIDRGWKTETIKQPSQITNQYATMKNYLCQKCKTHLQNDSQPSAFNCPKGGTHQWTNLGDVGSTNYQCKKCALLVQSKSMPSAFNCPSGGTHQWTKL
jgi:DNA-directed RNA polymerase subunit RPC12/RpoP